MNILATLEDALGEKFSRCFPRFALSLFVALLGCASALYFSTQAGKHAYELASGYLKYITLWVILAFELLAVSWFYCKFLEFNPQLLHFRRSHIGQGFKIDAEEQMLLVPWTQYPISDILASCGSDFRRRPECNELRLFGLFGTDQELAVERVCRLVNFNVLITFYCKQKTNKLREGAHKRKSNNFLFTLLNQCVKRHFYKNPTFRLCGRFCPIVADPLLCRIHNLLQL